jgi:hypothetical protein
MKTSEAGLHLMHKFEGFKNVPYLCPAHIWTIGWGTVLYQDQIRLPMARVDGKNVPVIRKEYPLRSELLNVLFYDLVPALLAIKAGLTLWSV